MTEKFGELVVLEKNELTKSIEEVNTKKSLGIRKYLDRDVINQKIEVIENTRHRTFCLFLWYSGLRVSEAVQVRKKDFDFKNYVLTVRWLKNRKYLYRIIPLHPNIRDVMQIYTAPMLLEDRVFPFTRIQAFNITKKYLGCSPHQLRHSFAVNWLRCGGDIPTLQRMLGHNNIQTTTEYLKIVPQDVGKELLKIQFR